MAQLLVNAVTGEVVFALMYGILAEARQDIRPGILLHAWQARISGFLVRFVSRAVPK